MIIGGSAILVLHVLFRLPTNTLLDEFHTWQYVVNVDGVQVADLTADAVQSLAVNHANGSVTLSLPLNQPLPKNAVTLNMTKYNTVPTNRSDDLGNIVTEMVTWGTSTVFGVR